MDYVRSRMRSSAVSNGCLPFVNRVKPCHNKLNIYQIEGGFTEIFSGNIILKYIVRNIYFDKDYEIQAVWPVRLHKLQLIL